MMAAFSAPPEPITYVTSARGGALSAGSTSVTVPAHAAGDTLIAFGAGQSGIPAVPAGWTSIATVSSDTGRYGRAVYKIGSGNSETVTFASGSGNSSSSYSSVVVLRNVLGIGAVAVAQNNNAGSTTITLPALTLQDTSGKSMVLGTNFSAAVTGAGPDALVMSGIALWRGATSFPATAATVDNTWNPIGYSIELLGAALPMLGQVVFTSSGTWTPPPGVTSFSAVAVQRGGAQGEANASKITVGGTVVLRALNGSRIGQGGGDGGLGGASLLASIGSSGGYPGGGTEFDYGGGGAAGYAGNGGRGGRRGQSIAPTAGSGGGGGGGDSDGSAPDRGGGVGLYGQAASGAAAGSNGPGGNGSPPGPFYGVGADASYGGDGRGGALAWANDLACTPGVGVAVQAVSGNGTAGAVRIIWGGGRSFPFNAGDM